MTRENMQTDQPKDGCQCPKCGRLHRSLQAGRPPSAISGPSLLRPAETLKAVPLTAPYTIAPASDDQWRTWGVIEIMIRNPNVDSFVKEKEAELTRLRKFMVDLSYRLRGEAQNDHMVDQHFTRCGKFLNDEANALLDAAGERSGGKTIYDARRAIESTRSPAHAGMKEALEKLLHAVDSSHKLLAGDFRSERKYARAVLKRLRTAAEFNQQEKS